MIILKTLQLHNFLSHADTILTFGDNDKVLIDGKSGSGKSSIVEAIIWALYGEARVENRNLVKHGVKSGSVTITLFNDADKNFYEIKRGTTDKAKNTLTVGYSTDGIEYKPVERNGLKDLQNWIEKDLLRASYTLFINSIAYPQDNVNNFVKQTATKRKDLLLEIANVTDFELYYNRARDLVTLKNEEKARISSSIETNLGFIKKQSESLVDEKSILAEIAGIEVNLAEENKKMENISVRRKIMSDSIAEISKIQAQVSNKKEEWSNLTAKIGLKEIAIKNIKDIDIAGINEKIGESDILKAEKLRLEEKINKDYERTSKMNAVLSDRPSDRDYDGEILEINKRLIPLIQDTGKCPAGDKCPFTIPIQNQITYLSEQINEKISAKAKLEGEKAEYAKKISSIEPSELTAQDKAEYDRLRIEIAKYEIYPSMLASAKSQKDNLPNLEAEHADMILRHSSLHNEIQELSTELKKKQDMQEIVDTTGLDTAEKMQRMNIEALETVIKSLNYKIHISRNARESIQKIWEDIAQLNIDMAKAEEALISLMAIKEAFGAKGLKTVVIDYLIPRLEDKINEILSKLSEFRVQLDTQKGTADGEGVIEGLFINIFNERQEQFEFGSYSGGERLKITVAISEALASLQKCGFRIFDELFIGLDEDSIEHFAEVMNQLQEKFKQMLCISHLRTIKDLFDHRVTITKLNGTSQVQ